MLADDVLFFVRRSPTIWAFDPVYIAAAVIGVLGARRMIPVYMLSHIVLNVATTAIILLYATLQALFGYDTERDIAVMFAIRIPLLAAVACGVPSYRLYSVTKTFRRNSVGQDVSNSMLDTAVGSSVHTEDGRQATASRREAQQAGAAALARARSEAGLPRQPSDELAGIKPEFLCPIMCTVMRDPHMTEVGNTYERESIQRWLRVHNTDPLTNVVMSSTQTTPNIALRSLIERWVSDQSGSV